MRSHIPTGGNALVLYGPHIGFSNGKELGVVERFGIMAPNGCCGSAMAAMRAINEAQETGSVASKSSRSSKVSKSSKVSRGVSTSNHAHTHMHITHTHRAPQSRRFRAQPRTM
mmetsp:Transcript_18491/g.37028  ORF Transcript_18491/g.37028 Transcript_18491/m.37028 type:complete len:113 (-) Transcript_18491:611-949(-)